MSNSKKINIIKPNNAISLFSGMGGDSLGLKQAGFNIIAYSEKINWIRNTHDINFPNSKLIGEECKGDINTWWRFY